MKARVQKLMQRYLQGEREGFSLVELIIVIAIMAILIAVVALAVIPYINSARESKDHDAVNNLQSAFKTVMAKEVYAKKASTLFGTPVDMTAVTEATADPTDPDKVTAADVLRAINKLTDKSVEDVKKGLTSDNAKDTKIYFQVDGKKCIVFLGADSKTVAKDNDGVEFKAE